jgi:hypothetical protein
MRFDIDTKAAKTAVTNLRRRLSEAGVKIPQALAYEVLAATLGRKDWNVLAADITQTAGVGATAPAVQTAAIEIKRITIAELAMLGTNGVLDLSARDGVDLKVEVTDFPKRGFNLFRDAWFDLELSDIDPYDLAKNGFAGYNDRNEITIIADLLLSGVDIVKLARLEAGEDA